MIFKLRLGSKVSQYNFILSQDIQNETFGQTNVIANLQNNFNHITIEHHSRHKDGNEFFCIHIRKIAEGRRGEGGQGHAPLQNV